MYNPWNTDRIMPMALVDVSKQNNDRSMRRRGATCISHYEHTPEKKFFQVILSSIKENEICCKRIGNDQDTEITYFTVKIV